MLNETMAASYRFLARTRQYVMKRVSIVIAAFHRAVALITGYWRSAYWSVQHSISLIFAAKAQAKKLYDMLQVLGPTLEAINAQTSKTTEMVDGIKSQMASMERDITSVVLKVDEGLESILGLLNPTSLLGVFSKEPAQENISVHIQENSHVNSSTESSTHEESGVVAK